MLRTLLSSLAVLPLAFGCSGTPAPVDGGTDAGEELPVEFDVSGTVSVHPDGVAYLADAGTTLDVAGLTARVEEPLKVALQDPLGVFSTQTLTSTGAFSASKVASDLVSLGVGVGVRDDAVPDGGVPRVAKSATVIYDVALEGKKPSANITGAKAYAVPMAFHDQLTRAVTPARILPLTGINQKSTLLEAGFILGRVVDSTGKPVAGVTVAPSVAAKVDRLFYPTADLSATGAATSSNGLFVYVHNGGDVETFRFSITGRTDYKTRNAGAAKDACLVVTVYPGTAAP